tara:strand:+ start:1831 stop:2757 length:927 start_codon:yes stop_codon:yes gene_type:complete
MENEVTVTPEEAGIPEVQIDDYSSNAVEELVSEMEKKDEQKEVAQEEEKVEEQKFARKFAALSRKEKQLKAKEAEYSKRLAELEAKLAEKEKPVEKAPELPLEKRFRQDPFKALEDLGIPYDKLTELALNDKKLTPDMQMKLMREEIESGYKSKFEELEKRFNEKEQNEQKANYERIQKNYMNKIASYVDQNPETYEFIKANNANSVIYDVVEAHYKESGKVLTIKDAADAVESHLEEEAEKLLKLNKVGKRLQAYMEQQSKPESTIQEPVTLTNSHSQLTAEEKNYKPMLSDDESKREIAKMLRWID